MFPSVPFRRFLFAICALGLILGGDAAGQTRPRNGRKVRDVSQFRRQHAERREKFAAALETVAKECESNDQAETAGMIRGLARPVDSAQLRLAPLPREEQPAIAPDLPAEQRVWRTQLRYQQQEYAKDLYLLSRHALNSGHVSYAYDLIREVALHDPDHVSARRILGYVKAGHEWLSAFESQMQRARKEWHDEFGWIPRDHVERYAAGERFYRNRWMSAAKEAELRRDFANAWEIRTEHYLVKTNHSLQRGVELARKLEDFHGLFFQIMAGFFNSPEQVQKLFAGSAARPQATSKPHVVHYYRTRDEYLAALRKETNQPIEITKGMYFPRNGIAFFHFDPEATDDSTLYHEATHQLLSGSRPQTGEIGMKSNFWIIEGIACYMESFQRDGDRFSVGDPRHGRILAARAHYLNEQYYVPLRAFTRMGMNAFQSAPEIRKNYSQGAALTHFFMHYDQGRYREALIEHLSQIYSPTKLIREAPESLEDLAGVEAEELDQQYGEYIRDLTPQPSREAAGVGE
jgi:hypothetical protein